MRETGANIIKDMYLSVVPHSPEWLDLLSQVEEMVWHWSGAKQEIVYASDSDNVVSIRFAMPNGNLVTIWANADENEICIHTRSEISIKLLLADCDDRVSAIIRFVRTQLTPQMEED